MIKNIIDLLNASDWYGEDEFKEMKEQLKRLRHGN